MADFHLDTRQTHLVAAAVWVSNVPHWFMCLHILSQLVALFGKTLEPLGGRS